MRQVYKTAEHCLASWDIVSKTAESLCIPNAGQANIREMVQLVKTIEKETGIQFVRMELGVPGLYPEEVGVRAEFAGMCFIDSSETDEEIWGSYRQI